MDELWMHRQLSFQVALMLFLSLMCQHMGFCWSRNNEDVIHLRFREMLVIDPIRALSEWKYISRHIKYWSTFHTTEGACNRRLLRNGKSRISPLNSPVPSPSLQPSSISSPKPEARIYSSIPFPDSSFSEPPSFSKPIHFYSKSKNNGALALIGISGVFLFIVISFIGLIFFRTNKVASVRSWATGLSGQLQKAFVVKGVQKLKRSELETACENFSNVVGSSSIGTVYKGTLSNGVEIAVISVAVTSPKDWTVNSELRFLKKINRLSKINHRNFVNLLGYCEEDDPFTRMMVFEYAPNGTLFEHLHVEEAEHLDWAMRLRIAMGIAYCLDHMHRLNPPMVHNNLTSLVINLTEDYAAMVSDFSFGNGEPDSMNVPSARPESNVYSFGLILLEMVTGRLPKEGLGLVDYFRSSLSLHQIVDPRLDHCFQKDQVERIGEVIRSCARADVAQRPTMVEVTAKLREITGISPDKAIPKLSPLWWAELEIMSGETN